MFLEVRLVRPVVNVQLSSVGARLSSSTLVHPEDNCLLDGGYIEEFLHILADPRREFPQVIVT